MHTFCYEPYYPQDISTSLGGDLEYKYIYFKLEVDAYFVRKMLNFYIFSVNFPWEINRGGKRRDFH